MRILAIETTDLAGSVAALDAEQVLASHDLNSNQRSAQSLAPAIVELLAEVGWRPDAVQLVAVASGPGSFTGLRVGITTAKMFAYTVGAEVLGVSTLQTIAWQAKTERRELWTAIDAQRNQVFAAQFSNGNMDWQPIGNVQLLDESVWLAQLTDGQAVSGPILSKLVAHVPQGVSVIDSGCWAPKAATVGALAWRDFQIGRRDDLRKLAPQYYRLSAAEEKLSMK